LGFSKNLEELMRKLDVTQEEIAKSAGVTPGAVSGWRRGAQPRKEALRNLCDKFDLSEDDLMSDEFGLAAKSNHSSISGFIPFVNLKRHSKQPRDAQQKIAIPQQIAEKYPDAYALTTEDDGMSKQIPIGSHVIINPTQTSPKNGSVVAVKLLDPIALQEFGSLWNIKQDILLRIWYLGTTNLMLSSSSYRTDLEDIIMKRDDITNSIDILGTVVWFQAADEIS
jgi:repressor LexA